jgi:4-amino-4-deoxy-L-arabinose transferase
MCAVGILATQAGGVYGWYDFTLYSQSWKALLGAVVFIGMTLLAVLAARQTGYRRKLALYAGTPILLFLLAPLCIPDTVLEEASLGEFLLSHADKIRPDTMIFSEARPLRSICWFYNRTDVYVFEKKGELDFVLEYDDSKHRFMNQEQFKAFVINPSRTENVVLITRYKQYKKHWQSNLPEPVFKSDSGERGYVFVEYQAQRHIIDSASVIRTKKSKGTPNR